MHTTIQVDFNLVAAEYNAADRRLILLDYDGTLVPFTNDPSLATPDLRLRAILTKLASGKHNDVVLISGRSQRELEEFFRDTGAKKICTNLTFVNFRPGVLK